MFHSQNDDGNFVDFYSLPGLSLTPAVTAHPERKSADAPANRA